METKVKIRIDDDSALREILVFEYEKSSQAELCKYALLLATHILKFVHYEDMDNSTVRDGYSVNEKWQAGFKIHQMARACEDVVDQTALRVVGQAVATGHMKEHAIVASDYAIKVVNLIYPNDLNFVRQERLWQIEHLKSVKSL